MNRLAALVLPATIAFVRMSRTPDALGNGVRENRPAQRLVAIQGSVTVGFDSAAKLAAEFWPDIEGKVWGKK